LCGDGEIGAVHHLGARGMSDVRLWRRRLGSTVARYVRARRTIEHVVDKISERCMGNRLNR